MPIKGQKLGTAQQEGGITQLANKNCGDSDIEAEDEEDIRSERVSKNEFDIDPKHHTIFSPPPDLNESKLPSKD